MTRRLPGIFVATCLVFYCSFASAQQPESNTDEAAIKTAIDSYVAAFNKGDAAAVAAHWNSDGELTTVGGETIRGQAAIEASLKQFFANNQGVRIEILDPSIRFLSPKVAIEEGSARVIRAGEEPVETTYSAVHVNQGGVWKMDGLSETETAKTSSHYEQLKELEWLIGSWVDESEDATVETSCQWTKNQNFISRTFKVTTADGGELDGTQVIGWDPIRKTIRSWMFDSEGGFGVGIWSQDGNQWEVRVLQTLKDGSIASAINVLTPVDEDSFKFKSTGREVGGQLLPNVPETLVNRNQQISQEN